MKVCRMCWNLVDDQLEICQCITGGSPVFFKDVQEMINHFVKEYREKAEKYDQITLRGTRPVTADWIREQAKLLLDKKEEINQLQEQNTKIPELEVKIAELENDNKQLKESMRQLEFTFSQGETIQINKSYFFNLKQKLEKIVKVMEDHKIVCEESGPSCIWNNSKLKEILEAK